MRRDRSSYRRQPGGGHRDGEEQRLPVRGDLQVGEARGRARELLLADHVDRGPRVAVGDSAAHLPREHERHSAARHGVASCFDDFPYVSRRTAVFGSTPLRRAISRSCSVRASAGLRPSGAPSSSLTASPPLMSRAAKRNRRRTRSARSSGASSHTAALAFSKAARASEYGAYMCMTCASFRTVRRQCRWSTACERACQAAWLSWYGCISLLSRLSVLRSWGVRAARQGPCASARDRCGRGAGTSRRTVARYCRAMVRAESPDASAAIMGRATAVTQRHDNRLEPEVAGTPSRAS